MLSLLKSRKTLITACVAISLLFFAGQAPAKSKKKPAPEPESSPHYMIYSPEEDPNIHDRKDPNPEPNAAPPSIASPERFMKSKPEREKSDLNQ